MLQCNPPHSLTFPAIPSTYLFLASVSGEPCLLPSSPTRRPSPTYLTHPFSLRPTQRPRFPPSFTLAPLFHTSCALAPLPKRFLRSILAPTPTTRHRRYIGKLPVAPPLLDWAIGAAFTINPRTTASRRAHSATFLSIFYCQHLATRSIYLQRY